MIHGSDWSGSPAGRLDLDGRRGHIACANDACCIAQLKGSSEMAKGGDTGL